MSHIQGSDYVGSMVVMEDGLPKRSDYRRFKIRSVPGNDDFAAMEEVLTRRLTAYLEQKARPVEERDGRFSYPPQLLLVDGGKGQLGVAVRVLDELGLSDEIPVASLAKQFEEVFVPGQSDPVRLPRQSEALYMLQRIRDESHRFAIAYHRSLRDKRMTKSVLDDIKGLGPTRRQRLRKEVGGVKAVREATLEQLKSLTWLPDDVAERLFEALHRPTGRGASSLRSGALARLTSEGGRGSEDERHS
jgi:excinuclease ABC subunit C